MSLDTVFALIGFAFVMSISPGPANFLLLASGANFGFRRSLPLVFGISLGFLAMVFAVGVGFGEVLRQFPPVLTGLRLACTAYVLWLAVKIGRSRSLGSGDAEAAATPVSFAQAALLQLLNPKAWAVALIVTVSFTDPADYLRSLLLMMGLFALVNLPSISVWALFGNLLRSTLATGRRLTLFNVVMAFLLVGSMIPMLVGNGS